MIKLHVGTSPLTNRIYAGYVLKDGVTWGEVTPNARANGQPPEATENTNHA